MNIGSIVETSYDFNKERSQWGLPYPTVGDTLTVSNIQRHDNSEIRALGIVLLSFEELPYLVPVCDKRITGEDNFVEVLPPMDIKELIEEPQYA